MLSSASLLLNQSSPGVYRPLNNVGKKILENGWAASTVRQYAAAVNKFFTFMGNSPFDFPVSAHSVYQFVLWCGKGDSSSAVISNTTKRYLTGLRMWHTLHGVDFPTLDDHRIRLLLKATKKDEPEKPTRQRLGLTLLDIHSLINALDGTDRRCATLKAVILVGFWGLARLGELTLHDDHPAIFIRRRDVTFSKGGKKDSILVRLAKTAAVGEPQYLTLCHQPNVLDPIAALRRLLEKTEGGPDDPLFCDVHHTLPVNKTVVLSFLKKHQPRGEGFWSGHSLHIGGASLRYNLGDSKKSLKRAGRWKSSAYALYIRKYSPNLLSNTKTLARNLNCQ